jgi:hypothetical protein
MAPARDERCQPRPRPRDARSTAGEIASPAHTQRVSVARLCWGGGRPAWRSRPGGRLPGCLASTWKGFARTRHCFDGGPLRRNLEGEVSRHVQYYFPRRDQRPQRTKTNRSGGLGRIDAQAVERSKRERQYLRIILHSFSKIRDMSWADARRAGAIAAAAAKWLFT